MKRENNNKPTPSLIRHHELLCSHVCLYFAERSELKIRSSLVRKRSNVLKSIFCVKIAVSAIGTICVWNVLRRGLNITATQQQTGGVVEWLPWSIIIVYTRLVDNNSVPNNPKD